jgi:hypothetical protein
MFGTVSPSENNVSRTVYMYKCIVRFELKLVATIYKDKNTLKNISEKIGFTKRANLKTFIILMNL